MTNITFHLPALKNSNHVHLVRRQNGGATLFTYRLESKDIILSSSSRLPARAPTGQKRNYIVRVWAAYFTASEIYLFLLQRCL